MRPGWSQRFDANPWIWAPTIGAILAVAVLGWWAIFRYVL